MSLVRRLPAAALVALLALLPVEAWYRVLRPQVVVTDTVDGLRAVDWSAAIGRDGRLAVRIAYDLAPGEHAIDVRVPPGARLLTVDGSPLPADIGRYGEATVDGPAVVAYELPGAVTRHADGAVLRVYGVRDDGSIDDDQAMYPCPLCYLDSPGYGNTALHGALAAADLTGARVAVGVVSQLHAGDATDTAPDGESDLLRFVASVSTAEAPALVALLPADAVPDAPLRDGSAVDAFDAARRDLADADTRTSEPAGRAGTSRVVAALLLTALLAALVAWIAVRLRRAAALDRDAGADEGGVAPPAAATERSLPAGHPPSDLEPALAGIVVGQAGPGRRSIAAGSLLALAHRGVIQIDGVDSRRFRLTLPAGAEGASASEEAVLAALRPQGSATATATLTGPPLWGPSAPVAARAIRRVAIVAGVRAGLVRRTLSALVLLPVSLAMGLIAVIATGGLSWIGWVAVVGGPILAVAAAILTGWSLTRRGRVEREQWLRYARWLRQNSAIEDVGAPGVAVWGEVLPHAAAIGAAPTAADALSPGV